MGVSVQLVSPCRLFVEYVSFSAEYNNYAYQTVIPHANLQSLAFDEVTYVTECMQCSPDHAHKASHSKT